MALRQRREEFLYLTTTGRKTGQPREIEIWWLEHGGRYYILAENGHAAQWVKNIANEPRVRVRLGDREFTATARALDEERDAETCQLAQRLGREKYNWGGGLPVEVTPDQTALVRNSHIKADCGRG